MNMQESTRKTSKGSSLEKKRFICVSSRAEAPLLVVHALH